MTGSSPQRYLSPAKPVDAHVRRVLRLIDRAAAEAGSRYFVAGAAARDFMLVNAYGLRAGRATRDIDFGIAVGDWSEFQRLKQLLMDTNEFESTTAVSHRLHWRPAGAGPATPVDIIPFGGVAAQDRTIAWPPHRDIVLNVAGFEEALESSVQMRIESDLVVRVASIPGLTVLKLIAWLDRRNINRKDATDFWQLLVTYSRAGNEDRIYGEELAMLESAGYDLELAGAELLGRDAAAICRPDTYSQIGAMLASAKLMDQLTAHMRQTEFDDDAQELRTSNLLERFSTGFSATSGNSPRTT